MQNVLGKPESGLPAGQRGRGMTRWNGEKRTIISVSMWVCILWQTAFKYVIVILEVWFNICLKDKKTSKHFQWMTVLNKCQWSDRKKKHKDSQFISNVLFVDFFCFVFIKFFYKIVIFPLSFHFNLYKIRSAVTEESEGSRQRFNRDTILSDKYCVCENYVCVTCITILVTTRKRGPHKYSNTRQYV